MEETAGGGGERPDPGAWPTPLATEEGEASTAMASPADGSDGRPAEAADADGEPGRDAGAAAARAGAAEEDGADGRAEVEADGNSGPAVSDATVTAAASVGGEAGTGAPMAGTDDASPAAEVGDASPAVEVDNASPAAEVDTVAPVADVDTVAPAAEVDAVALAAEVDRGAPVAEVDTGTPVAEVETGALAAEVDTGAPAAEVDTGAPAAEVDALAAEVDTGALAEEVDTGAPAAEVDTGAPVAEVDMVAAEADTVAPAVEAGTVAPTIEADTVAPTTERDTIAPTADAVFEADAYAGMPTVDLDKDDATAAAALDTVVTVAAGASVEDDTEAVAGLEEDRETMAVERSQVDAGAATEEAAEVTPRSVHIDLGSPASSRCSVPLSNIKQHATHVRSNSFQRFRKQMQRAWRWGPGSRDHVGSGNHRHTREQSLRATMNLEVMANQKRQWYMVKSKARDHNELMEPTALFEHFFIVGLHSSANVEVIEDAFAKRKNWESEVSKSEILDLRKLQYDGRIPTLEPEVLFKYPPGKRVAMRASELPAFCFPEGVKARLIERTPSMSDLNEIVLGQEHLSRDDLSFIFCLKGSDNAPLYGVCLHVQEIVQRAPGILGAFSPIRHSSRKPSRFLVSAARCYCILTRVPFFELHYEMLNSIIAQERLDRITNYVAEMALLDSVPHCVTQQEQQDENTCSPDRQLSGLSGYAIPVDSVSGFLSSSSLSSEKEALPFFLRPLEPQSPESVTTSEISDYGQLREIEKDNRRISQQNDDYTSETSGSRSDSFERLNGCFENGETSPDVGIQTFSSTRFDCTESLESMYTCSVKDGGSDDEDDELSSKNEPNIGDEKIMGWAKAHNNEALQIVCGYHRLSLPKRGGELVFHPLEHFQPIKYCRPGVSSLGLGSIFAEADPSSSKEPTELSSDEVNSWLAAAEEAFALSLWTVSTVCRSLSLESVLALFAGALLEKQVVVICPNLGVLSAIVLSVIPMIRPFQWQSLLLPILPRKMLDFLDAPVPFIVGIQHKSADIKMKTANLIQINVNKDKVKACSLPQLPQYKELVADLGPIHAKLSCENSTAKRHPIYKCSEVQAEAAGKFLDVMKRYLESLCSNLRSHTITNVRSNNDKVSLLLKESFIDSFPVRDQPFIKLFIETQLFSVLSDSKLSRYEKEHSVLTY